MLLVLEPVLWRLVVIHICLRNPLPAQGVVGWLVVLVVWLVWLSGWFGCLVATLEALFHHFGLDDDLTMGVRPRVKRFLVLLKLTMLKMIRWST